MRRNEIFLGISEKKILKFPSISKTSEQVGIGEPALYLLFHNGYDENMAE